MTGPGRRLLESARAAWSEAAAGAAAGLIRRDMTIAGVRVRLEVVGDRLAEVLLPAFEVHQPVVYPTPEVVVRAYDSRATGVPLPEMPSAEHRRVVEWPDADGTTIRWAWQPEHGQVLLADPGPDGVGHLAAIADAGRLPWWEHGAPLRQLLAWAMRGGGRHFLHAAAVGERDGVVLLAGPGGAGKSSTAVSSLLAGLRYLGDDYCVLTLDDGPVVHLLYGTAKLLPDQLRLVDGDGHLDGHVLHPAGAVEAKTILVPTRWAPELVLEHAPITAVVVPSQEHPRGFEPISRATALRHLAPTSILQLAGGGGEDLQALATLVRSVPCFRLGLAPDRAANPPRISRFLDDQRHARITGGVR